MKRQNRPEEELEKWDSLSAFRDFPDGVDPVWDADDFVVIEKLQHGIAGLKILDLGCGAGHSAIFFLRRGAYVTGVDLAPANVEKARQRAASRSFPPERYRFLAGNVFELDGSGIADSYDVVFCSAFLHHFFGGEVTRLGELVKRLVKPGGHIILYENSDRNILLLFFRWLVRRLGRSEGVANEYPLDRKRIKLFAAACGRKATIHYGNCTFAKLGAHYLAPLLMSTCARVDKLLHRIGLSPILSYRQIVVFEE